ncbi:MAG: Holliday junction branch migration DNA helicase RuvB [Simkaniaceae bacterium]|nr:Holliday junction branch migration DNA helicase RuvB [Simkaniaceae bacterium]
MDESIESSWKKSDYILEKTLRPYELKDFAGQSAVKERLEVVIGAAKKRGESLPHTLFCGPPGLGKTTLAHILAHEMGGHLTLTSGPTIDKAGDLAGLLTNLEEGDFLFIDEIHRLARNIEEYLYPAMEDFKLDLMLDSGPSARSVTVNLKKFTLIGATTRSGLLSAPLRSRFGLHQRLDYYSSEVLACILKRSASLLNFPINDEALLNIASRSRGTPRIANSLLKWVRDFAEMRHRGVVNLNCSNQALEMLHIDKKGLDEMDKKILSIIIEHHKGGPVGVETLAAALGEEARTIEEVHEPYLIMEGFLRRTPRGREVTTLAYQHLERT